VLFAAGATRSLNFSAVNTLAFVDIHDEQRPGASALATMLQQATMALSVAVATLSLSTTQHWHGTASLQLADFRIAWFLAAALMALSVAGSARLPASAGHDATR
jgi:hypothetical protein